MHWSVGFIVTILVAFAIGAWFSKTYPGSIPVVT